MAFGVLAYPKLKDRDFKLIQDFRKENDALYYSIVAPHFSFVFPVEEEEINKERFIDEIFNKTKKQNPLSLKLNAPL